MYNKDKQELYGTLNATYQVNTIKDNYYERRDIMANVISLMTFKRFRRCNKILTMLSMNCSMNQSWFNDIVRIYENYTNERERLTSQELRIYYNYCIINRIILPH